MEGNLFKAFIEVLSFNNIEITEIVEIEQNCGTIWLKTNEGKIYSMALIECEEEEPYECQECHVSLNKDGSCPSCEVAKAEYREDR